MSRISRVAVVARVESPQAVATGLELADWLSRRGLEPALDPDSATAAGYGGTRIDPAEDYDLVVALGGDGTLLVAARALGSQAPILGVNLGRLGFLTEVPRSELYPSLVAVFNGEFALEERSCLEVRVERPGGEVEHYRVLNDAVVSKSALSRIIEVTLSNAGGVISRFRADGVIVSTPTGSTAYNLSAGGPIIDPALPVMVITPICPHTLSLRPLVMPDSAWAEIRLESQAEETFLSLDGREGTPLDRGDRVRISRARSGVRLVRVRRRSFYDNLREKLHWGGLEDSKSLLPPEP
ncbi:MAG: NAD(+)/NADH kinase [Thermoanaerobaculia bacterium]